MERKLKVLYTELNENAKNVLSDFEKKHPIEFESEKIMQRKNKALNLIFNELQSKDASRTTKEIVLDILDSVVFEMVNISKSDCQLGDIRECLLDLFWIKKLIKKC